MAEPVVAATLDRATLVTELRKRCFRCRGLTDDAAVLAEHDDCHGWSHCDCCGECESCLVVGAVEADLDTLAPVPLSSAR